MERIQVLNKLQEIVRDVLDNEEVVLREETCMEDVEEWDSVAHMTVIAMLENEIGVQFDIEKIANAKTVKAMIDMVVENKFIL